MIQFLRCLRELLVMAPEPRWVPARRSALQPPPAEAPPCALRRCWLDTYPVETPAASEDDL